MVRRKSGRSHLEEQSFVPLLVVICILTTWHLFRTAIFFSVPQHCLPTYEFWIEALPPNWPLWGGFVAVFYLLLAWVVCLVFSARPTERKLLMACVAGILLIGYGLTAASDSMEVIYLQETSDDSAWNRTQKDSWEQSSSCENAKPYLGKWRVVSTHSPFLGQEFPYRTIELRRDGSASANVSKYRDPIPSYWNPPSSWSNIGWIGNDKINGYWTFELQQDRLTLITPDDLDQPISTVVLERM